MTLKWNNLLCVKANLILMKKLFHNQYMMKSLALFTFFLITIDC